MSSHIKLKKLWSIMLSLVMVLSLFAGLGSVSYAEDDVIEIYTIADLYAVNNDLQGNYLLMNDLDLSAATAPGGAYILTVVGIGNCTGTRSFNYSIYATNPVATSISKVVAGKKAFTVYWSKKSCTGYQVRYSTKSSMASAKTVTVSGSSTASKKITGVSSKKTYYVQVRTYKKIGGTAYYSSWSSKKSVKVK